LERRSEVIFDSAEKAFSRLSIWLFTLLSCAVNFSASGIQLDSNSNALSRFFPALKAFILARAILSH